MITARYYHRYYLPNNCTLVVVGDIDPKEALTQIEATFGALPAGPEPPKVTAKEPKHYGPLRVEVHREAQFPSLLMNYHVPNWESPEAYPLELLARILSSGRSSRLYHNLVYQQKLALEAGADYNFDTADPFIFMLAGQPMPGKTAAQLEAALEAEIKRLQTDLVGGKRTAKGQKSGGRLLLYGPGLHLLPGHAVGADGHRGPLDPAQRVRSHDPTGHPGTDPGGGQKIPGGR